LRRIAREVGRIVSAFPGGDAGASAAITRALSRYSEIIRPWAKERAAHMVAAVEKQDRRQWESLSQTMATGIREEIRNTPIGNIIAERMAEQVELITSLPTVAAERVQRLSLEALTSGQRASEVAKEIMRTGEVTESRAKLIARTEVSRTSTLLTQARAEHIGSEGYLWRTVHDNDVRHSHKAMEGKYVAWNDPPTLDGLTGHAGALPNCRCYPEPVIPGHID
jgi:SPP1 gp7 family putative phage head morphogenesis protein